MSSRRLVQRRTATGASTSARPNHRDVQTTTELPPYEAPSCAVSADGRRALVDLSNNRDTRKYEEHMRKSIKYLGESTAGIHDNLRTRKARLAAMARKKDATSQENLDAMQALEEYTTKFEGEVSELTEAIENTMREMIDSRVELEDEKNVMRQVSTTIATRQPPNQAQNQTRRRRRRNDVDEDEEGDTQMQDADEDEEEEPALGPGPFELLNNGRHAKAAEYEALTVHQKYGLSNDYAAFKKLWHDAVYDAEIPLPDARRWFDSQGRPVMGALHRAAGSPSPDDDEELVIAGENISLTCPLTLKEFEEPYGNRKCKHVFEKDPILDFIGRQHQVHCPQTGCDKVGPALRVRLYLALVTNILVVTDVWQR
jgi:E3 SUMO-protein ligase NSE2